MSDLVKELSKPDEFANDWYAWATNQLGHVMIGITAACALSLAYFWYMGELPYKAHLFGLIAAVYVAFELSVQKWRRADTIEDCVFVCGYGAGGAIYSVSEVHQGTLNASIDLTAVSVAIVLAASHLAFGIGWRMRKDK